MTRTKSWTLTDVANDIWLDNLAVGNGTVPIATPHQWAVSKRTLRGGIKDGVDLIEVHNGAMTFSIVPTRGMGLWRGQYHGNFLGWRAPIIGPVHPQFVNLTANNGLGWLAGFDEWMCRCGLSFNGPPGEDVYTDKSGRTVRSPLTLHGKIANIPAHFVEVRINLDPPHELIVTGQVLEASLFSPHLCLTATYTTIPGSSRIVIHDLVENRSAQAAELQMLYHCNVGAPFLEAGSRVVAPVAELAPLTARAAEGIDTYETYPGPTPGFTEQVYCYDLLADAANHTLAMLYNAAANRGMVLRFNRKELPCFTVWRNTAAVEDGYVTGLEPATNYPNLKSFERDHGRVAMIPPGGRWETTWSIEIFDSHAGVANILKEIVSLQAHAKAKIHRTPQARFSRI